MSKETKMDIDYVSKLARIDLLPDEREKFQAQLGDVLQYFEKLQNVAVEGVDPTAHAFPRTNVWDQDSPVPGFSSKQALQNAPQVRNDQVIVPKVVEE
ncbi:MAG: Asp-tRNA(Asn)/Glu-tRNA(Gln) amidotransferase GatCAB subunit C [Opitutae bacterium]|nr:Asp-tRNA(Asn)/Glu-tRNA(Gln) amidotransferase GatCAB subunit C [Opitutae bacterium]|tara:strand:- start:3051 stop:3344 length:294 start_codon:yes stop_codon:yes gene_type:complete